MKVLKFGGTSVGKPENMQSIASLIEGTGKKVIVLSALSGTTNALVLIGDALQRDDKPSAISVLDGLKNHYRLFLDRLFQEHPNALEKANNGTNTHFKEIEQIIRQEGFTRKKRNILLSKGEMLSTLFFQILLEATGQRPVLLSALDFMRKNKFGEPEINTISARLQDKISSYPEAETFITQGYICRNHLDEIDNLGRGGSDYSATLIGAALSAEEVQIWTDIDGMHNNDPRIVDQTKPIQKLSFDEAAELAYFGAKILHPQTVLPAKQYNIPVRLLHTLHPEKPGTLITNEVQDSAIKAVAAKDGITAIKIKSGRMLMAYGFMRRIFELFEKYQTPVDMVTTSEVGVSITIDSEENLDQIVHGLEELGHTEVQRDLSIVCIVGYMPENEENVLHKIFSSLSNIPIRMVSYGGSRYNVSLLVPTNQKAEVLKKLNIGLFGL